MSIGNSFTTYGCISPCFCCKEEAFLLLMLFSFGSCKPYLLLKIPLFCFSFLKYLFSLQYESILIIVIASTYGYTNTCCGCKEEG